LWYAAGEANAPGLYFAESKDKGQSFSQGQLVAKETVRGTPILAPSNDSNDSDVAIWEMSGETKLRKIGNEEAAISVGSNSELPAATVTNAGMYVAYIAKVKEKRSVWLIKANHR